MEKAEKLIIGAAIAYIVTGVVVVLLCFYYGV